MKTNEELRQDVMDEIKWNPLLHPIATQIGVTANDGLVTLSGMVETYAQKSAAERAAQQVAGVTVVAVDMEVRITAPHVRSDIEIAEAARNALKWHSSINEDDIEVKVENGWVYLDGTVEWEYLKRAAENAVSDLIGVKGVNNSIDVKSKTIDSKEIKGKIAKAFHRSATIDSSAVTVTASGSRVILAGKVRSWAERREAENAAWSSPGVMAVDNKIEIDTEILV
jgi:osmotically-inducible protein OsmY